MTADKVPDDELSYGLRIHSDDGAVYVVDVGGSTQTEMDERSRSILTYGLYVMQHAPDGHFAIGTELHQLPQYDQLPGIDLTGGHMLLDL